MPLSLAEVRTPTHLKQLKVVVSLRVFVHSGLLQKHGGNNMFVPSGEEPASAFLEIFYSCFSKHTANHFYRVYFIKDTYSSC